MLHKLRLRSNPCPTRTSFCCQHRIQVLQSPTWLTKLSWNTELQGGISIDSKSFDNVIAHVHKITKKQTAPWNQRKSNNLVFRITVYISKIIQKTSFIIRKGVISINMLLLWRRVFKSLQKKKKWILWWERKRNEFKIYKYKREGGRCWTVIEVQEKGTIMTSSSSQRSSSILWNNRSRSRQSPGHLESSSLGQEIWIVTCKRERFRILIKTKSSQVFIPWYACETVTYIDCNILMGEKSISYKTKQLQETNFDNLACHHQRYSPTMWGGSQVSNQYFPLLDSPSKQSYAGALEVSRLKQQFLNFSPQWTKIMFLFFLLFFSNTNYQINEKEVTIFLDSFGNHFCRKSHSYKMINYLRVGRTCRWACLREEEIN